MIFVLLIFLLIYFQNFSDILCVHMTLIHKMEFQVKLESVDYLQVNHLPRI